MVLWETTNRIYLICFCSSYIFFFFGLNYFLLFDVQLGNPETSDAEDWRGLVDYAWSHAVISDETHKIIRESCDFDRNDTWSNKDCTLGVDEVLKQYKEIDIYSLYTSVCIGDTASSDDGSMQVMMKRTSTMVSERRFKINIMNPWYIILSLINVQVHGLCLSDAKDYGWL